MSKLVFHESPTVEFATNTFDEVPVILQYESVPLIQLVHEVEAGYNIEIPIFHPDGTYLAKAVGSQLYLTNDGKNAGVNMRHFPDKTVCEMEHRTLFEIQRTGAASLRTSAELYCPDGSFLICNDAVSGMLSSQIPLEIWGSKLSYNKFIGGSIGILVRENGSLMLGVGGIPSDLKMNIDPQVLRDFERHMTKAKEQVL